MNKLFCEGGPLDGCLVSWTALSVATPIPPMSTSTSVTYARYDRYLDEKYVYIETYTEDELEIVKPAP